MKKIEISNLEFSICLDECEDFTYEVLSDYGDREDHSEDVSYEDVNDYIHSLIGKVEGFFIGEHRTYGNIYYYDNGTMDIILNDCDGPSFESQVGYTFKDIPSILPKF